MKIDLPFVVEGIIKEMECFRPLETNDSPKHGKWRTEVKLVAPDERTGREKWLFNEQHGSKTFWEELPEKLIGHTVRIYMGGKQVIYDVTDDILYVM